MEHFRSYRAHILPCQSPNVLYASLKAERGLKKSALPFPIRTQILQARRGIMLYKPANQVSSFCATHQVMLDGVTAGDLVLIHGSVLHKSERNTSSQTRYAYTFHMIDSPAHANYDEKNWLQPTPSMPFTKVLDLPNDVINEISRMV
ncbi:hypothetical protein J3R82DRAFT_10536 [Butyriboletus roseoflavus]|nr:hypothetical protein J3R82DRAFT_10536 [Butyriboletus roseoflavus]